MMWKLAIIFCIAMSAFNCDAVSSNSRSRKRRGYAGGYAGASAGAGSGSYTGGGTYSDYDDYDSGLPGFIDPYSFHQQLTNQILAQNAATHQAITGLATSGAAMAKADASIAVDDTQIQNQIAAQQAYHNNLVHQYRYKPGSYYVHRYAPNYALAAGSIGPGGYKQTAFISPASASTPNIVNRFGSTGGGGGYKGVSVSSFSSSGPDGTNRRGAQTTINDNGKVTSYTVHS